MQVATFLIGQQTLTAASEMQQGSFMTSGISLAFPESKITNVLLGSWTNFDELYLACQWLWSAPVTLYERQTRLVEVTASQRGWPELGLDIPFQAVTVTFQLETDLAFSPTALISEHALAKLVQFRRRFQDFIAFDCRPVAVDIRRSRLCFEVLVPNVVQAAELFEVELETAGREMVQQKLDSSWWQKDKLRFGVTGQEAFLR